MPTVINGLPAHVLLVHVVVIGVPLGALFTVLSAVWPAARARLGVISPLTCLIALVFVPITTHAGEWLRRKLEQSGTNPAIEHHANLGRGFLPYAVVLFLVSAAVWWLGRRFALSLRPAPSDDAARALPAWATIGVAVVSVAVSGVAVWQLYRVGDSGAHAAWDYVQHLGK